MPTYLQTSGYKIYFWSNENDEPVHFHIAKGVPQENDTKIWVLSNGSFEIAHNKGKIPQSDLNRIFSVMSGYYFNYIDFWKTYLHCEKIKFYK